MRTRLAWVAALVVLLTALDQLYRVLHPEVNPLRATLVGLSALLVLEAAARAGADSFRCRIGALAIFVSAMGSVAAIARGWLLSRSTLSAAVHVVILASVFLALDGRRSERGPARRNLRGPHAA